VQNTKFANLRQHCDFLLNVFNLVLGLFQVDDLDGDNLLCLIVDSVAKTRSRGETVVLVVVDRLTL
jgi:hypothetical protein